MTRTGKSARLSSHVAEPFAEVNTEDALRFAVRNGELATLRSDWGSMVVRVRTGNDVPRGMVFAPIHWNRAFASDARVGALMNPVVDPISGEPELKHTPVAIEHFEAEWYGVMLTRSTRPPPATQWWTKVQGEKFVRYELAGNHARDWSVEARRLLGVPAGTSGTEVDFIEYHEPKRRVYRAAWFVDERLEACIYFDQRPSLPERGWLARLFSGKKLDAVARNAILAGRAIEGGDPGALVCSCFGVGRNPIAACARALGGAASAAEIGKRLKCGTNCGSCVPEIEQIVRDSVHARADERAERTVSTKS
jgi:assimilatory nitrate reductase catalytic subunit